MQLLDGKHVAGVWLADIANFNFAGLKLGVILVGEDPASTKYIERKQAAAKSIGTEVKLINLPASSTKEQIFEAVEGFNTDPEVAGFIVQMPLPDRSFEEEIINAIDPAKDIDGLTPPNLSGVKNGTCQFIPATALAVKTLLEHYGLTWTDQDVVVVGQGKIAGLPIADLAESEGAKVTRLIEGDLLAPTLEADYVISAVGKPGLLSASDFKSGAVVVDVGTTLVQGKLKGDIDSEGIEAVASYYTPVPGGVGPMTVSALMHNFQIAAQRQLTGK